MNAVNLSIREGEFVSLLGPSGCGKTTLLRIIAGLESVDEASEGSAILWRGRDFSRIPARERPFNMVFQRYALFPHLNVFENIAFAARLRGEKRDEIRRLVASSLEMVGLAAYSERHIETLSGGQQQRVALARALAARPEILLLDEPLSALDRELRDHMQTELRLLQKKLGMTFIFVTHDQEEALSLSDRVALFHGGRVEQIGPPRDLYDQPASVFTARFIGRRNQLRGKFIAYQNDELLIRLQTGTVIHASTHGARYRNEQRGQLQEGTEMQLFLLPEALHLTAATSSENSARNNRPLPNQLRGRCLQNVFRGEAIEALIEFDGGTKTKIGSGGEDGGTDDSVLRARVDRTQTGLAGQDVLVNFSADAVHAFPAGAQ